MQLSKPEGHLSPLVLEVLYCVRLVMVQLKLLELGTALRLGGNEWKMQSRRRFNRKKSRSCGYLAVTGIKCAQKIPYFVSCNNHTNIKYCYSISGVYLCSCCNNLKNAMTKSFIYINNATNISWIWRSYCFLLLKEIW